MIYRKQGQGANRRDGQVAFLFDNPQPSSHNAQLFLKGICVLYSFSLLLDVLIGWFAVGQLVSQN
jgi:hypothetical protein